MIPLAPPFRLATAADGSVLAELVNAAGEGLPEYLWSRLCGPGEDRWSIGAERQARRAEDGQIVVAEIEGAVIAALTGYATPAEPLPVADDMPAMFVPLQELENLAPAMWYVNILATLPPHRGQGWGTRLLRLAEEIGRAEGLAGLSIIASDANTRALALYGREGYREAARRAMVKDGWRSRGREWVLLTKAIERHTGPTRPTGKLKMWLKPK